MDAANEALKNRRILVIEDDAVLLKSMASHLTQAGAIVAAALDGQSGLDKFRAFEPDLVITDIIMPEKEGIETIMAMKAARPTMPVMAISGGGRIGSSEFLRLALSLGANAAMAKPFRNADLVTRASGLLGSATAQ